VRNLLGKRILEDIREAWERDGAASLKILAKEDPGRFAQLGVAILPKDILVSVAEATPGGLSAEDWSTLVRVLDLIKACVPASANPEPGEVFTIIEGALRAHYAKEIACPLQTNALPRVSRM
jgi:hypothetical protein